MPIADTNGIRTNYLRLPGPEGAAEEVVMVHGLGTALSFWYFPHAARLAKRHRVTLYDLRGHGRSGAPPAGYGADAMAADLEGLLDAVGIERAHLVAHSFGGVVALAFACRRPDRVQSLVVADTQVHALRHLQRPQHKAAFAAKVRPVLERHGIELDFDGPYFGFHLLTALAELQLRGGELPPEARGVVGPLVGGNSRRTADAWLRLLATTSAGSELMSDDGLSAERLAALDVPVLALYGEQSRAAAIGSELARRLPRAAFDTLPGGHYFPCSSPDEFLERCEAFWARVRAGGGAPTASPDPGVGAEELRALS